MLLAVCQECDVDVDPAVIPKIAFCFAGGIGNTGDVCGAVAGAVMAIGLTQERSKNMEVAFQTLAVAQEFRRRFEEAMGTIICRELTGMDLSTPEGVERFMHSDKPQKVCFPAVDAAYTIAVDMLAEKSQPASRDIPT